MKTGRLLLLLAALVLSAILALALRPLIYELLVVPLSYLAWQVDLLIDTVPELIRWTILVVVLALFLAWQLMQDFRRSSRLPLKEPRSTGQVQSLSTWLLRARSSNYFKWQLAYRLGRVSRRLADLARRGIDDLTPSSDVADFLAAGLSRSFVDFPAPRNPFKRRAMTALDIDPARVVQFLESQIPTQGGDHADRL